MKYSANPKQRSFSGKFSQIDRFGQPVSLTYQGSRSFKTPIGAVLTLVIAVFMAYVSALQLVKLFQKEVQNLIETKSFVDYSKP